MEILHTGLRLSFGLFPVLCFLLVLMVLDSYKLVRRRTVAVVLALGGASAVASLLVNRAVADSTGVDAATLTRALAPAVEELLKGTLVVVLIVRRRVGFLVDSAIVGFAVGAGFAAVENIHYLVVLGDTPVLLWMVRGFGTALMHGSVTAMMAMLSKRLTDRQGGPRLPAFLPGWLLATGLHSLFNSFYLAPTTSAVLLLVVLPAFFVSVFHLSERGTRRWLGTGFDTDAELLELIGAGRVSGSRVGTYLRELKSRFPSTTVADMVCLMRLRLELSIKAKGMLLAREAGFTLAPDPEIGDRFAEIRFLEHTIGATGLLALKPVLHLKDRDLWQYHMLDRGR